MITDSEGPTLGSGSDDMADDRVCEEDGPMYIRGGGPSPDDVPVRGEGETDPPGTPSNRSGEDGATAVEGNGTPTGSPPPGEKRNNEYIAPTPTNGGVQRRRSRGRRSGKRRNRRGSNHHEEPRGETDDEAEGEQDSYEFSDGGDESGRGEEDDYGESGSGEGPRGRSYASVVNTPPPKNDYRTRSQSPRTSA